MYGKMKEHLSQTLAEIKDTDVVYYSQVRGL